MGKTSIGEVLEDASASTTRHLRSARRCRCMHFLVSLKRW